jgi:phosphatidylglycerol:prolipoprotein diacylglycerol transferase
LLVISIDPVAFSIGALQVRWYGIMVVAAVVTLLAITFRETKQHAVPESTTYNLLFWGVIGGIIGGKLGYLIQPWLLYGVNPSEIISPYGWALHGAIIGGILGGVIYWRIKASQISLENLPSMGDAIATGAPLAQAIGRIGCTINGCCYGKPSPFLSFPWAVIYTPRATIPSQYWNVPLYPTQIYFLLWNLIVFAVIWRLRGRLKPQGSLVFLYLCLYSVGDFGLRFLRADPPLLLGLREGQIFSLAVLLVSLPILIIKIRRFQQKATVEPTTGTTQ